MKRDIFSLAVCFLSILFVITACHGAVPEIEVPRVVPSQFVTDPTYYDGIIVITQYFTYLDLSLFENAYQLLHSARPNPQSFDDFLLGVDKAYQSVAIKTIQPYVEWARQNGLTPSNDPEGQKRFYVAIMVIGEEGWWPDNNVNIIFTLESDHGNWRIVTQDTIAKK